MAEKKAGQAGPQTGKTVTLKGVKVAYVDSPSRIEGVYRKRNAKSGEPVPMGSIFVHLEVEINGKTYRGLSQTLGILGEDDYQALLDAHASQSPIDIDVRFDDVSAKTGNYFFFVHHDVAVGDIFAKVASEKPVASGDKLSMADLKAEEI